MKIQPTQLEKGQLLDQLSQDYGFEDSMEFLQEYSIDSVIPGICPVCGYSTEVEHDCRNGWCEECNDQTVISGMVLADII